MNRYTIMTELAWARELVREKSMQLREKYIHATFARRSEDSGNVKAWKKPSGISFSPPRIVCWWRIPLFRYLQTENYYCFWLVYILVFLTDMCLSNNYDLHQWTLTLIFKIHFSVTSPLRAISWVSDLNRKGNLPIVMVHHKGYYLYGCINEFTRYYFIRNHILFIDMTEVNIKEMNLEWPPPYKANISESKIQF